MWIRRSKPVARVLLCCLALWIFMPRLLGSSSPVIALTSNVSWNLVYNGSRAKLHSDQPLIHSSAKLLSSNGSRGLHVYYQTRSASIFELKDSLKSSHWTVWDCGQVSCSISGIVKLHTANYNMEVKNEKSRRKVCRIFDQLTYFINGIADGCSYSYQFVSGIDTNATSSAKTRSLHGHITSRDPETTSFLNITDITRVDPTGK